MLKATQYISCIEYVQSVHTLCPYPGTKKRNVLSFPKSRHLIFNIDGFSRHCIIIRIYMKHEPYSRQMTPYLENVSNDWSIFQTVSRMSQGKVNKSVDLGQKVRWKIIKMSLDEKWKQLRETVSFLEVINCFYLIELLVCQVASRLFWGKLDKSVKKGTKSSETQQFFSRIVKSHFLPPGFFSSALFKHWSYQILPFERFLLI